jgi:hypothetical protein
MTFDNGCLPPSGNYVNQPCSTLGITSMDGNGVLILACLHKTNVTDPLVWKAMSSPPVPVCSTGYVLTFNGAQYSCVFNGAGNGG